MNALMREAQTRTQAMVELLDSWASAGEEEAAEQRETFAALKVALDEDRPYPQRKLFPEHEVEEHRRPTEEVV